MKIYFNHYGSEFVKGDTIERLPILDWEFWYARRIFEFKNRKFTGKYHDGIYLSVTLFRHRYCLSIDLNYGNTTSELAKKEYHDIINNKEKKMKNKIFRSLVILLALIPGGFAVTFSLALLFDFHFTGIVMLSTVIIYFDYIYNTVQLFKSNKKETK